MYLYFMCSELHTDAYRASLPELQQQKILFSN